MQTLCDDLVAETDALTDIVKEFSDEQWLQPTVAEGWDTLETILHLGATDLACYICLLYTSPSPRDATLSRMPSSA